MLIGNPEKFAKDAQVHVSTAWELDAKYRVSTCSLAILKSLPKSLSKAFPTSSLLILTSYLYSTFITPFIIRQ